MSAKSYFNVVTIKSSTFDNNDSLLYTLMLIDIALFDNNNEATNQKSNAF